ncbi:unnamed protein product [Merluccius merluccius]
MGASCRKTCPCVETLRARLSGDKNAGGGAEEDQEDQQRGEEREAAPAGDTDLGCPAIYKAVFSYRSRDEREMSFREGDLFEVTSREGDWWAVRKVDPDGRALGSGYVPGNFLKWEESVDAQPWYFGNMSRFEAQSHLMCPQNKNGAFLVRLSQKGHVGYVLSVKQSRVKHFKVFQSDTDFWVEKEHVFCSLADLVNFYQSNQFSTREPLGQPCKRMEPHPADLSKATVDEWELPKEEFTLQEQLGSGYFADVYRGLWKNQINVAVKIIKTDSELNHQDFHREVQILKGIRHRHLISLFAICTASPPYYIITELMQKGNLLSFLRGSEGAGLEVGSLIDMASQVANGMSFLEENKSIHRDLAARNVLVGENYICKIADFGLARIIKEPFYITQDRKIPYKWSAPEAISHGRFSNKSDVWSFGVLLYEIITHGGAPYPALSNQEAYQKVASGYRMPCPSSCPNFIYSLMLSCWHAEDAHRPDFKELYDQLCTINSYDI